MRAAIYERISKDRTGEEAGVTRQDQDCVRLANDIDATVVDKYVDNDTSATNRRKPRKHYLRMLDDIRAGRLDTIICWHPDRLYRQPRELEDLIELVEQHRILVRSCRAGELDLSTPTGRMVGRLFGAIAKYEVEHKTDRWLRSVQQSRESGKVPGSRLRMFGYTAPVRSSEGVVLEPGGEKIDDEAARVEWMATQVLRGVPLAAVARELNESGVSTVTGARWHTNTVRSLLMHPRLAGFMRWQGEVIGQGEWAAILDEATWRAVRALLAARNRPPGATLRASVLLGLATCHCGTRMHTGAKTWKTAAGERRARRTYRCPVQPPYDTGCGKVSVIAEPVEEMVEDLARRYLDTPRFRKALRARSAAARSSDLADELHQLEDRYAELKTSLTVVTGRVVSDVTSAMADLDRQIKAKVDALSVGSAPELPPVGAWPKPEELERRSALIRLAVGKVWVDPHPPGAPPDFDPARIRIDPVEL